MSAYKKISSDEKWERIPKNGFPNHKLIVIINKSQAGSSGGKSEACSSGALVQKCLCQPHSLFKSFLLLSWNSSRFPVSLALLFLSPLMWFLSPPGPKTLEPQLSSQPVLSLRSLPTSSSCYCCSSFCGAPCYWCSSYPGEGGKGGQWKGMAIWSDTGLMKRQKNSREAEGQHICQNSSERNGKSRESSRQMEWVCERERRREGVWQRVRWERRHSSAVSERGRVRGGFIIHVCEIRIKLNRLLGIILRDFPTWD